jgi:hypothetical protein
MDISFRLATDRRRVPRRFLTAEEKDKLKEYFQNGKSAEYISEKMKLNLRNVREHMRALQYGLKNEFSKEEDDLIIEKYKNGITKPSELIKYLKGKSLWMVRNRINFFIKKGFMDKDDVTKYRDCEEVDSEKEFDLFENENFFDENDFDIFRLI